MSDPDGDKADLQRQIEKYFQAHAEAWRAFVSEFLGVTPDLPLVALAKFFVIRLNQPFDMPSYMKAQAEHIRRALDAELEQLPANDRQKLVAEWLRQNAQSHRDQIILDQARHIDDCADTVEPFLRGLLTDLLPPGR
jgi:DNA-binding transcriptional regulator YbjK